MRNPQRGGFAIPFVLLVLMVLSILTTAAAYRYTHTTRFLRLSQDNVRARALADSGLEMALVLMRDEDIEWYKSGFSYPVTSSALGLSQTDLGGGFELYVENYDSVYPSAGTYRTVRCVGRSGAAEATSLATIKLTSPLTNYLFISNGNMQVNGWGNPVINGPIFVNANGDEGDFRVWHDYRASRRLDNLHSHSGHTVTFNAQISAVGDIYIQNVDGTTPLAAAPHQMNGKLPPGQIVHEDLDGVGAKGKIILGSELSADPGVELNVDLPSSAEVVGVVASHPTTRALDISSERDGVLVEFIDGKMVVSRVAKRTLGFLYDKDVYNSYQGHLSNLMVKNTGNPDTGLADQKVQHQVAWDDPGLDNAPYPPDLVGDINGDGTIETEGDRVELKKIVRGPQLASYNLSNTSMTSVQLLTSNTSYDYGFGSKAPPVFVRGNVDGKAMLSYNVTDESLDPGLDRLDMMILNEHEMPGDSGYSLTSGPGIPGGVRYANPSYKTGPGAGDPGGSDDELIMMTRGSISGSGMNTAFKQNVRDLNGNPFDLSAELKTTEQSHVDHFSGGPWGGNSFRMVDRADTSMTNVQAVLVANQVTFFDHQINHEGVIVPPRDHPDFPTAFINYTWGSQFASSTWPDLAADDEVNALALRMRNALKPSHSLDNLKGIIASLGNPAKVVGGSRQYNYEWRRLDATELGMMGLPLSVVLCSWQRL